MDPGKAGEMETENRFLPGCALEQWAPEVRIQTCAQLGKENRTMRPEGAAICSPPPSFACLQPIHHFQPVLSYRSLSEHIIGL